MSDKPAGDRQDGEWGFARDIDRIMAERRRSHPPLEGGQAKAGPSVVASARRRKRMHVAAAVLAVTAVLVAGGAWWQYSGPDPRESQFAQEFLRAVAACGLKEEAGAEPNRRVGATTIARLAARLEQGRPVGTLGSRTYAHVLRRWRDGLSPAARDEYARRCLEAEHHGVNMKEDREFAGGWGLGFLETAWNLAADPQLRENARARFEAEAAARFAEATAEWDEAVRKRQADSVPSTAPPPEKPTKQEMTDWDSLRRGED